MKEYLYAGWFENKDAFDDDEDKQWVMCILIKAQNEKMAKSLGIT